MAATPYFQGPVTCTVGSDINCGASTSTSGMYQVIANPGPLLNGEAATLKIFGAADPTDAATTLLAQATYTGTGATPTVEWKTDPVPCLYNMQAKINQGNGTARSIHLTVVQYT